MYFYFIYTSKSKCLIFKHPDTRDGRFVVGNALKVSYLLENTHFSSGALRARVLHRHHHTNWFPKECQNMMVSQIL